MFTWSVENTIIFNVLKTMGLSVTEIKNTWAKILEVFKARLNDENTFSMFFADSYVSDIVNNTIKIVLNSSLAVTLCQNKAQVYENLKEAVLEVMETDFNLEFYTSDDNLKNKNVSNSLLNYAYVSSLDPETYYNMVSNKYFSNLKEDNKFINLCLDYCSEIIENSRIALRKQNIFAFCLKLNILLLAFFVIGIIIA